MSQIEPEEALDALAEQIMGRVNVALPAEVISYDATNNRCNVRPTVRANHIDEDTEERIAVRFPIVTRVPVALPRFGSYFEIQCPLQAGDHVLLLVCDRSIDEYVQTGQADNTPQDIRRFDFSDAVAMPLLIRPRATDATTRVVVETNGTITIEGTAIKLGDSATKLVALAPNVATELAAIAINLNQCATYINGLAPGTVTPTPYTPGSVAASKTKAE